MDAVRTSVEPKVIHCPDPERSGKTFLSAVARNGVELKVRAQVTVRTNLTQLIGGATEAEVTALFAPIQMSPRCIMVHASSGIERLDELQNMTVALSAGRAFALYMQKKLSLEGVRVVGYPGSMAVFLNDKNFAQQGYVFSEPFLAEQQGGDPHVLMVSELGFNPYASLLITRSDTVDAQPQLVAAMVRASKQGWQTYLESPEKTINTCSDPSTE